MEPRARAALDWVEPNVCVDEHMSLEDTPGAEYGAYPAQRSYLGMQPWSVPALRADVIVRSGGDGDIKAPMLTLPGRLLMDQQVGYTNDTPVDQMVLIRITRGPKTWHVSNPNAVQFRDRWTFAVNRTPPPPVTSGVYNSQAGSAIDLGTNAVAEPESGVHWVWAGANSQDEWTGPLEPGEVFNLWYRMYVWNPPPWSNNSNKNSPKHAAAGNWTRIQIISFPEKAGLVSS